MASEIRVNKIENRSGLGTVTFADTGVDLAGIVTATTFSGSGASLTALPAGNLTGTVADARISTLTASKLSGALPAISAASLTNVPAANVVGVHTSLTVTNATTTGTAVVGGGVTISESGIEASGIGITCASINETFIGGRRNLIINGSHQIAQRGTAAVTVNTSALYRCVDRYKSDIDGSSGGDWSHAQSTDVPSGQGFINSSKITVVTQASQPSSEGNRHQLYYQAEKQDVTYLEWGTSSAKTCTLSFWVKSSVAGIYALWFQHYSSGGSKYYFTNYTINATNTWEKKSITLTGSTSGGNVSGTSAVGFRIEWGLGYGSDAETGTLNEWTTSGTVRAASNTVYLPENSGATFYLTGCQFEVGSQATPFEHRSFGEELSLCQRYYYQNTSYGTVAQQDGGETVNTSGFGGITMYSATYGRSPFIYHPVMMRATPTVTFYSASNAAGGADSKLSIYSGGTGWDNVNTNTAEGTNFHMGFKITTNDNFSAGYTYLMGGQFSCDAEL